MSIDSRTIRIDPETWHVTTLKLPKRFTRGAALGFCGRHAVGVVESSRGKSAACWWPEGEPELLEVDGSTEVSTGRAGGDVIPGHSHRTRTGGMRAVAWSYRGGKLVSAKLHDPAYEDTWATCSGGDTVAGVGSMPGKPGQRGSKVGLLWRDGRQSAVVESDGDVLLLATDGTRLAGSVDGRAALWPSSTAAMIDLAPVDMPASEVQALDGDVQVGMAWKGMCARAGYWQGTAESFSDLTPRGFETSRAYSAARGLQVGFARAKDTTRNGSTACDNRAALWEGAAQSWFDLNSVLPAKAYNASVAFAIEIRGDTIRIGGQASRFEVSDAGTARECHGVPVAHPVLWSARIA